MASGEGSRATAGLAVKAPDTITVTLSTVDALQAAQTFRTLTRTHKVPPGVAEILNRVGNQMLAEVMAVLP